MKITSSCGVFWMKQKPDGLVEIGLTSEYMAQIGIIWTFLPRATKKLEEGKIFVNFESSKRLGPLHSPLSGTIEGWNQKYLITPDVVSTDDFILTVRS